MSTPALKLENITAGYDGRVAISELSFAIYPGEFVCLLGPTGCGKSTTLHVIAGFVRPYSGVIFLGEKPIATPRSEIGVVFQQYALFPWLTARENVEFPMRLKRIKDRGGRERRLTPRERRSSAESFLRRARIPIPSHADRYPDQLSGGEQQRVAIARALAAEPQMILMDEPFGSLDAQTRMRMQDWLMETWQGERRDVLFVTHDVEEAILLADRILVMSDSPGTLREEIKVDLPRPRSQENRGTGYVNDLRMHILSLLKGSSSPDIIEPHL